MTGRSYRAYGEEFALNDSEYADDTALVFGSRSDCVTGIPLVLLKTLVYVRGSQNF